MKPASNRRTSPGGSISRVAQIVKNFIYATPVGAERNTDRAGRLFLTRSKTIDLKSKSKAKTHLKIMPRKARVNLFWPLGVVTDDRIAGVKP